MDHYAQLVVACQNYFRWESMLFRTGVAMDQEQLDAAAQAFNEARERILQLIGDAE